MASQEINGPGRALHACSGCKTKKRRCDKRLPRCSLCSRTSRECNYSEQILPSTDNLHILQNRVDELEALLAQVSGEKSIQYPVQSPLPVTPSNHNGDSSARLFHANPLEQFPAMFFLDHEMFREARMSVPRPNCPISEDVYRMLGSVAGLRKICDRFFTSIHKWFPILSCKRFELMLASPIFEPTPETALLISAMYLLTDTGSNCQSTTRTNSYWTIKNYAVALEVNAVMTPQLLQANVLIALYEIGHAIYPAAYMSVGKCATLGKALGLDNRKDAPQMLRRYGAWAELEELRRVWWAVLLLDRYVHLSIPGHALTTEDPFCNEVLPADDAQFDAAEMAGSGPLYVASPTNIKAGPFARACQAAHLMGKVVVLLNDFLQDSRTRFVDAIQLYRTLSAFIKVVEEDFENSPEPYATAMALAHSALIMLCDPFCCTEMNRGAHTVEETDLQTLCITGIKDVADNIARFTLRLQPSMVVNHGALSPLLGHCLYMATVTFAWRVYEGETSEALDAYRLLRSALRTLNGRWAVAGEYLEAIETAKSLLYHSPLL